jgi:hypothetical protein
MNIQSAAFREKKIKILILFSKGMVGEKREHRGKTPRLRFINHRASVDGCPHSRPNVKSPFDDAACFSDGSDADEKRERRSSTNRPGVKTLKDLIPS